MNELNGAELLQQFTMEMQKLLAKYQYHGFTGVVFTAGVDSLIYPQVVRVTAGAPGTPLFKMATCYMDVLKNINTVSGFQVGSDDEFTVESKG